MLQLIETVGILKRPKVIDVTVKSQTASSLVESCIFCTQSEKVRCSYIVMCYNTCGVL